MPRIQSMSKILLAGILPFLMIVMALLPSTFAENPSPYDEWDFDIISERFTVTHNPQNPEIMNISVPVKYNGEFPTGTTNVDVVVTDPTGREDTMFGKTLDLQIGHTQPIEFDYLMSHEGTYTVDAYLKSPSDLHKNWPFDNDSRTLEIKPNGLLKELATKGTESGLITSYFLDDPLQIRYDEVVHAKITLPDDNNFEKIVLVNGDFVKQYSTDVKDIYIDGNGNYDDMAVKLVQHGNLLPMADAQETLQEYVVFYAMDKGECTNAFCVKINHVDADYEVPVELIAVAIVVVVVIVGISVYVIKTRPAPYRSNVSIGSMQHPVNEP